MLKKMIRKQIENISKEIENIKRNQKEIPELKSTITEMKNSPKVTQIKFVQEEESANIKI